MSAIVKCSCKHEFQDKIYGKSNRLTTPMKNGQYRCTICLAVHGSQSITKPVKVKETVAVPEVKAKPVEKVVKPDEKSDKTDKKKSLKGTKR